MKTLWMAMATFTLVGAITPGPVNLLAMRHGQSARAAVSSSYVLGASAGYAGVVALMGLGAGQVLHQPLVVRLAQWVGAAYLAWLAWRIAVDPVGEPGSEDKGVIPEVPVIQALAQGALTQVLNPKAWLVALSGVTLFVLPQAEAGRALWAFGGVSLVMCGFGVGCWAAVGRLLMRWLAPVRRQRLFNRALGGRLAVTVVGMLR